MKNKLIYSPCVMQPNNIGLHCVGIKRCGKCGWNPVEAERRRKETIERMKENKQR